MTARKRVARATNRLDIEGELTIITATETKNRLVTALESGGPLTVDLSGVTELDTAGLQLLLLARRETSRLGSTLTLTGISEPVANVLAIANLDEHLECPARPVSGAPTPHQAAPVPNAEA